MRAILSAEGRQALRDVRDAGGLLGFDFDGTLAPIVKDRGGARMRQATADRLRRLCAARPVAVVTGRALADLEARLDGVTPKYLVGNHGLEPGPFLQRARDEVAQALPALEAALAGEPGLDVENKGSSLSVHYRASPHRHQARGRILQAAAALPVPMRCVAGKMVVNVVPQWAPDKGDAMQELMRREGTVHALYVGDDITDEHVFRHKAILSVRVGVVPWTAAGASLENQLEIDQLLDALLA